mgnify:CR=1 FL=1
MSFEHEKRAARRILAGIEDGKLSTYETFELVSEADPALIYFIFAWLRAHYPSSNSLSDGVLGRLGRLCTEYPKAARRAAAGESDSIVAWFQEGHRYGDYNADAFIDLIVDKLES